MHNLYFRQALTIRLPFYIILFFLCGVLVNVVMHVRSVVGRQEHASWMKSPDPVSVIFFECWLYAGTVFVLLLCDYITFHLLYEFAAYILYVFLNSFRLGNDFPSNTIRGLTNSMFEGSLLGPSHTPDNVMKNYLSTSRFDRFKKVAIYPDVYAYLLAMRAGAVYDASTVRYCRGTAFAQFPEVDRDHQIMTNTCIVAAQMILALNVQDGLVTPEGTKKLELPMYTF